MIEVNTPNTQLDQQRVELGAILGMEDAVPVEVLEKAVSDPAYAHDLLVSRREPEMLAMVLRRAKPMSEPEPHSSAILVKSAAKSLISWAKTGFSTVDDVQYQSRLQACEGCEHLRNVPTEQSLLYRLAGVRIGEDAVCGECGCGVKVKARRVSENCPVAQEDAPHLSKWGERLDANFA